MNENLTSEEITQYNKGSKDGLFLGTSIGVVLGIMVGNYIIPIKHISEYNPRNAKIEYIQDSIPALVFKNGDVYVNTPENTFVLRENFLNSKLEEIVQQQKDSIMNQYKVKSEYAIK